MNNLTSDIGEHINNNIHNVDGTLEDQNNPIRSARRSKINEICTYDIIVILS